MMGELNAEKMGELNAENQPQSGCDLCYWNSISRLYCVETIRRTPFCRNSPTYPTKK